MLTQYIMHNDNKFDYDSEGIAQRKHIIVDKIRYIGKISNNLDDNLTGIKEHDYLEYENSEEFKQWVLTLKPKDFRNKGISKMALWKIKNKLKEGKMFDPKTKIVKILIQL